MPEGDFLDRHLLPIYSITDLPVAIDIIIDQSGVFAALYIEIDDQLGRTIRPGVEDPHVILKICDLLPLAPNRHVSVLIVDEHAIMSGGEGAVDQGDIRLSIPIQVLLSYTENLDGLAAPTCRSVGYVRGGMRNPSTRTASKGRYFGERIKLYNDSFTPVR